MKIKTSILTCILSVLLMQAALAQPVFVSNIPANSYGFFNANGTLYFFHQDSLWKSNGTAAGTVSVKDLGAPGVDVGEKGFAIPSSFFFITENGPSYTLWRSNGTAAGTTSVATYSEIHLLEVFNDEFYYSALEGGTWKLYKIGAGAPVLLKNFEVHDAEVVGTILLLAVRTLTADELWKTNGTPAGTALVKSFQGILKIENMKEVNGLLFFEKENNDYSSELWKSNGTNAGTVLVKSFGQPPEIVYLHDFQEYNNKLFFIVSFADHEEHRVYISDGSTGGTILLRNYTIETSIIVDNEGVANGLIYYSVYIQNGQCTLWVSNGTVSGTFPIHKIHTFEYSGSNAKQFVTVANHVMYLDNNNVDSNGNPITPDDAHQLWQSDLTAANTVPVKDLFPPATFPNSDNLTNVNEVLYFTTLSSGILKLWKYNPNAPSTPMAYFTVVDASTDTDRAWLMEGDTIVIYPGQNINIRYNPAGGVGSIRFLLNGPTFRVESAEPFALAGDNNGNYNIWNAAEGHYTLEAREYAGDGASGTFLGSHTIHFYVDRVAFPVPGIPVVNAGADKSITLPTTSTTLTGTASDADGGIFFVEWSVISQPGGASATFTSPNALNTAVTGLTVAGTYVFRLTAIDNYGLTGTDDITVTVSPSGPAVTSFTLVNADTDTDIMTINNGTVINFAALPTANVNIRANTNPATVGSVRMTLDALTRIENAAPYAIYGDDSGNYKGETLTNCTHTMTARPYNGANATGTAGTQLSVNFTVTNSPARMSAVSGLVQTSCFPNPSSDYFNINVMSEENASGVVEIYDEAGKLQETLFEGNVQSGQELNLRWNATEVQPGIYILKVKTGDKEKTEKLIVQ